MSPRRHDQRPLGHCCLAKNITHARCRIAVEFDRSGKFGEQALEFAIRDGVLALAPYDDLLLWVEQVRDPTEDRYVGVCGEQPTAEFDALCDQHWFWDAEAHQAYPCNPFIDEAGSAEVINAEKEVRPRVQA